MMDFGIGPKDAVRVDPFQMLIDYDVIVRDGSIPGGNWNESWVQLFQVISKSPLLMQKLDVVRIFMFIARSMGAKNIDDFEIKTMPNEQVMNQVQQGNLVPAGASYAQAAGPFASQ